MAKRGINDCNFVTNVVSYMLQSFAIGEIWVTKLLIADTSEIFGPLLRERLGRSMHTKLCYDGLRTLEALREFRPDVLVLELSLPGIDGLTLLRLIHLEGFRPAVLVTTTMISDYILRELTELRVDYAMRKPVDMGALLRHIQELARKQRDGEGAYNAQRAVTELLHLLGFSQHLSGTVYLREAVVMTLMDPVAPMAKKLYASIMKKYGLPSPESVERAIRTSIHKAWETHNPVIWRAYFSTDDSGRIPRPSIGEAIHTFAQALRLAQQEWAYEQPHQCGCVNKEELSK